MTADRCARCGYERVTVIHDVERRGPNLMASKKLPIHAFVPASPKEKSK